MNTRYEKELALAGLLDKKTDFYGGMTGKAVLELLKVFSKQGHSGMSASVVSELFHELVKGKCLSPLTGKSDEWNEIEKGLYQNNRVSSIFASGPNGEKAFWLDGIVFMDGKAKFTSYCSRVPIKFPWMMPKTKYRFHWTKPFYNLRMWFYKKFGRLA